MVPARFVIVLGLGTTLALAAGPGGENEPPSPAAEAPRSVCLADVEDVLAVRVVPLDAVHPGATVNARVEIAAARAVDGVVVRFRPQAGIDLLSPARRGLGSFQAGERRSVPVAVAVPADGRRRTVAVDVEATLDGFTLVRGAVLNLAPEGEPAEVVEEPGGRRVRQVSARRIG